MGDEIFFSSLFNPCRNKQLELLNIFPNIYEQYSWEYSIILCALYINLEIIKPSATAFSRIWYHSWVPQMSLFCDHFYTENMDYPFLNLFSVVIRTWHIRCAGILTLVIPLLGTVLCGSIIGSQWTQLWKSYKSASCSNTNSFTWKRFMCLCNNWFRYCSR